jgi:hypothetical protein
MSGPGTAEYLRSVAVQTAMTENSQEWRMLSTLMCWDAVAHCIELAGFPKITTQQMRNNQVLARISDPVVDSAAAMAAVPAGNAMVFYSKVDEAWIAIHAMLSVGDGRAAGNKNACIGLGGPIGWEVIDLTQLTWSAGAIKRGSESIHLHHRPASEIGTGR